MLQELPILQHTDLPIFTPQKRAVHKITQCNICTLYNTYVIHENNIFRKHQQLNDWIVVSPNCPVPIADAHPSPQHGFDAGQTDFSVNWIWTKQHEHENFYLSHPSYVSFQQELRVAVPQWAPLRLQPQQCCWHNENRHDALGCQCSWAGNFKRSWKQF